jgi:hypothetical protein
MTCAQYLELSNNSLSGPLSGHVTAFTRLYVSRVQQSNLN